MARRAEIDHRTATEIVTWTETETETEAERETGTETCSPPPIIPSPSPTPGHSARAERMEWWRGWLLRSGAFPLRSAWGGGWGRANVCRQKCERQRQRTEDRGQIY